MSLLRFALISAPAVVCVQTFVMSTKLNPILASISFQLINDFDIKIKPKQQIDVGNIG